MLRGRAGLLGLAILACLAPGSRAQFETPTASPFAPSAGAVPGVPGVPAAPAAAGGFTLHGFLGLTPGKFAACRANLCQSQFGQLLNSGTKPLGALTGGLFPSLCPPSSAFGTPPPGGDPTGAQSVASAVQQDTAAAKARVAAVEYLGTVDCHYWPDAAVALSSALRADRNECVRYAAARVLGTGCCCTKKTIDALTVTVAGTDTDGNPSESSERVKATALVALQKCMLHYREPVRPPVPPEVPDQPIPPESPEPAQPARLSGAGGGSPLSPYDRVLARKPIQSVFDDARRAVAQAQGRRAGGGLLTGQRYVFQAFKAGVPDSPTAVAPPRPAPIALTSPDDLTLTPRERVPEGRVRESGPEGETARPQAPAPKSRKGLYGILVRSIRGDDAR